MDFKECFHLRHRQQPAVYFFLIELTGFVIPAAIGKLNLYGAVIH
jgi:hypothetical protein